MDKQKAQERGPYRESQVTVSGAKWSNDSMAGSSKWRNSRNVVMSGGGAICRARTLWQSESEERKRNSHKGEEKRLTRKTTSNKGRINRREKRLE